jgi:hypothetical protein
MISWPMEHVEVAANGHLIVSWPNAGHSFYIRLHLWLRLRHGLRREGRIVSSPDNIILPDLVGAGVRLNSGWDNWSGYYLLSTDNAGDQALERIFGRAFCVG